MAIIPASASRKFNPGDYKGAPAWFVGRFLSQLNLFVDPVYLALLNGLTFLQNFNAQYYTQLIVAGALPTDNKFSFRSGIKGTPLEIIKAACNIAGNLTLPLSAAVDFSWYFDSGTIFITAVSGLTAGTTYNLTLRVC